MERESPDGVRQRFRKSQETPMKWKSSNNFQDSPKSSLLFSAQARSYEKKIKYVKKVKNPFAPEDPTILEGVTCSPGLLQIGEEPEEFSWSIDELSVIKPANIGSSPLMEDDYDGRQESIAQAAIENYFSFTHSVTTPEGAYMGTWRSPASSTPSAASSARSNHSTPLSRVLQKFEVSTQTTYSFPPVLPPHIEEILKPYICNIESMTSAPSLEHQNSFDADETNLLNTSTLRRKLFFNNAGNVCPVKFDAGQLTPPPARDTWSSRVGWGSDKREKSYRNDSAPSSPDLSPIKSDMSLGSQDLSSISHTGEVSMVTIGSLAAHDVTEEMAVSTGDHHRIFSSTVMPKEGTHSGHMESGYATNSYTQDNSVANFMRYDF